MTNRTFSRFKHELDTFFLLVLLNCVFGALALALGIQFIVASILGLPAGQTLSLTGIVAGAIAMVCLGLGLSWIVSSARILGGIKDIRTEFKGRAFPVPDETLISGIVRMIAHYRENRKTIQTMILVCTLCGFCFLALGIQGSLEFATISFTSGTITLNSLLLIPSALLALGIAAVSLISSYYFRNFSRTWDLRQIEISRSEHALAEKLGRD
mgnify:CR=1 FL=1|jgi:hypothetical protein